jgi:hypothetical protein
MTRTLSTARTPAKPPLVALLSVLAFAGAPGVAVADVEIPLDSAVSQQYQAAEAVVDAAAQAPATPAAPPVPDIADVAPAAPPAPQPEEPRYHADPAPQYQVNDAPSNSDFVSQAAGGSASEPAGSAPAAEEPPKPPAEEPRAPAREAEPAPAAVDEPALAVKDVAAIAGSIADMADVQDDAAADPTAAELPLADSVAVAPTVPLTSGASGGNVNVSIRIFSPGDDGPVTQVAGGGGGPVAPATGVPTTWIWNWHWSGGGGCDPGAAGNRAPPLGVAGWTWTWTCGPDAGSDTLPLPGMESLPEIAAGVGIVPTLHKLRALVSLPGLVSARIDIPGLEVLTHSGTSPAKTAADAPESRAGRERPGTAGRVATHSGPLARVQASPALAATPATTMVGATRKRPAEPRADRDIKRVRRLIPGTTGAVGPPVAAAAYAAASAASGSGPALLATLVLVFLSVAAGWLLTGVGLPRLKPRSSRLERPG